MKTQGRGLEVYTLCTEQTLLKARRVRGCIHPPHIYQGHAERRHICQLLSRSHKYSCGGSRAEGKQRLTCLLR